MPERGSLPPPRLYLAGPDVFVADPAACGAELKAICAARGAVGLFPIDGDLADAADLPAAIRDANMAMIRSCDAVIANMTPFRGPSMDPGTAYEMGAAAALGKPVVGYTSDARSYVERVSAAMRIERTPDGRLRDPDGLSVEEFEAPLVDNLMMAHGVAGVFPGAAEAVAFAVGLLKAGLCPDPPKDGRPLET